LQYSRSNGVCVSFSTFFSFCYIPGPIMRFSNFNAFSASRHISCPTMGVSHLKWFLVFSPYSRSYSVHFSFSTFFSVIIIIIIILPYFRS
jgi:hypothetical protein